MEKKKKVELILIGVLVLVALISLLVAQQSRSAYLKLEKSIEARIANLTIPYLEETKILLMQTVISARVANFGEAKKSLQKADEKIGEVLSAVSRQTTKRKVQGIADIIKKIEKEIAAGKKDIGARANTAIKLIDEIIHPQTKKK